MGTLLKFVLGFASGPAAWLATALGWLSSFAKWCVKHWKIVACAVALAVAFGAGDHWRGERDAAKVKKVEDAFAAYKADVKQRDDARAAQDAVLAAERERAKDDEKAAVAAADKARDEKTAELERKHKLLMEGLKGYVEEHSKPAPLGACPTDTDIGAAAQDSARVAALAPASARGPRPHPRAPRTS